MSAFDIAVFTPVSVPVLVPGSLDVQPQSWSAIAKGGMWDAEVMLFGPLAELSGLTAWLGYRLEIVNGNGMPVWWGDIVRVEVIAGGLQRGISLERMANKVMVRYAELQPGGGAVSTDTDWSSNALSQAAFGVWERRLTPGREMKANEATALQSTALNTLSEPHYSLAPGGGAREAARLYCTGYWQRGKRIYFTQTAGIEEHNISGTAFPLGLGIVGSSLIAFSNRAKSITSMSGQMGNFASGTKVKVTGAANGGNNVVWTVANSDDRAAVSYTSTNVNFTASDDIADNNAGLAFIANDDVFTISGTNSNNGAWLMDREGAINVEVNGTYHGGAVTSESPGDTVVFARGNAATLTTAPTNEHPGSAVTVTAYGERYYQSFTFAATGSWTVDTIEIRLRRVGGPSDDVTVQLVNNAAGSPGTLIEGVNVVADDIPLEMGWVAFNFANTATLNFGSSYGITVLRSGANSPTNYYEIEVDDGATYSNGTMRQYDGAAWQTPSPGCDLVFRILGGRDTGSQIADAILASSWALDVEGVTSGIVSNQWRDGELRAFDELNTLLDIGSSSGARLLATTTRWPVRYRLQQAELHHGALGAARGRTADGPVRAGCGGRVSAGRRVGALGQCGRPGAVGEAVAGLCREGRIPGGFRLEPGAGRRERMFLIRG